MTMKDDEVFAAIQDDDFQHDFIFENMKMETLQKIKDITTSVEFGLNLNVPNIVSNNDVMFLLNSVAQFLEDNMTTRKRFLELAMSQMKDYLRRNAETSMGPILNFRTQS